MSTGTPVDQVLPGGGGPNPYCADIALRTVNTGESAQSVGT